MLDRNHELGEGKEGNAWWSRKTGKSHTNEQKMQPKSQTVDKSSGKQQDKNYPSNTKDAKYKKMGKPKGNGSK